MEIGLDWERLSRPVKWKKLFKNNNPVDCEIGFGNGKFLAYKCVKHPERNLFGIDYSRESYKKALKEIEKANLSNIRIIHMEARAALTIFVPIKSISHIYINFPDPWPKKKHEKNRLLDKGFFTLAATRTKKCGQIIIVTDDPFYRDFLLEEMEITNLWKSLFHKGYTDELSGYYKTKYEKKWRELDKEIYYMIFQKKKHPDNEYKIREYSIDEIGLSDLSPSIIKKMIEKTIKDDDSVAKLIKCDKTENIIKMNILLKDGTLLQKKTFCLKKSKDNKWKLQVPDNFFCTHSFKIFTDRLKTLSK